MNLTWIIVLHLCRLNRPTTHDHGHGHGRALKGLARQRVLKDTERGEVDDPMTPDLEPPSGYSISQRQKTSADSGSI
jgi:hypothetical protein